MSRVEVSLGLQSTSMLLLCVSHVGAIGLNSSFYGFLHMAHFDYLVWDHTIGMTVIIGSEKEVL